MKKIFLMAVAAMMFVACSKPEKSIENLKSAATGESNASAMYAEFAKQAKADSLFNVALMFEATSAAEAIHAKNHLAELAKLGVKDFKPVVDPVKVDSTLANLYAANSGEEYEYLTMYPEFITVAQGEQAAGAELVFEWAKIAEEKHSGFYKAAIETISATGNDLALPTEWLVCAKCGDTFRAGEEGTACPLCGTAVEQFVTFKN